MHILIVDDELLARSRLRTLLADCDPRHSVTEAAHAADALAQLERRHRAQAGQLLFLRERRRLASGTADDDAADASAGQVSRQPRQCGVVHGPVAKRGDEGNPQAREIGRGNSAGA